MSFLGGHRAVSAGTSGPTQTRGAQDRKRWFGDLPGTLPMCLAPAPCAELLLVSLHQCRHEQFKCSWAPASAGAWSASVELRSELSAA